VLTSHRLWRGVGPHSRPPAAGPRAVGAPLPTKAALFGLAGELVGTRNQLRLVRRRDIRTRRRSASWWLRRPLDRWQRAQAFPGLGARLPDDPARYAVI